MHFPFPARENREKDSARFFCAGGKGTVFWTARKLLQDRMKFCR